MVGHSEKAARGSRWGLFTRSRRHANLPANAQTGELVPGGAFAAIGGTTRTRARAVDGDWTGSGQDDLAARKWEEFQNQPTSGQLQQKGRGVFSESVSDRVAAKNSN